MKNTGQFLIVFALAFLVWDCQKDNFVQELNPDNGNVAVRSEASAACALSEPVREFPFTEDFDAPFDLDGGGYFLPHWWGNEIGTPLMGQSGVQSLSPPYSLFLLPQEEEEPVVAELSLDLTGRNYTYLTFALATLKNGGDDAKKRTRLSISHSINGAPFSFATKIGPERGFENQSTGFESIVHPLPAITNGEACVRVRFNARTGGGPHEPVILLIDDVVVDQADQDIFAPYLIGEVRPLNVRTIELQFSEPLLPGSAESNANYSFRWPDEDPHGEAVETPDGKLPKVVKAELSDDGHRVRLAVSPALDVGTYYGMSIQGIEDLHGNTADFEVDEIVYNMPAPGALMITEIFFADPSKASGVQQLQFVEIYNPGNKAVPLGGLRIKGAISAHNMPNVKLGPGEFWVITRQAEAFEETFGFPAWEWKGSWIQRTPEDMEPQVLFIQGTDHHSADLVDYVSMDFTDPAWMALNQDGYAVELKSPVLDNQFPENWQLATRPSPYYYTASQYPVYATPGTGPMAYIPCQDDGVAGVSIIHKSGRGWVTICVAPEELAAHLAHGDWMGS